MTGTGAPSDGAVVTAESVTHRSSREPEVLQAALASWLRSTLPADAQPEILELSGTSANGQSSETVLFAAEWTEEGARRRERLVARLAPAATDVPVFPAYDLSLQHDTIRAVAAHSSVPVPELFWNEPDPSAIGTPFFVMGQVDGLIPPDVMPYTFGDNWLHDATVEQQRTLERSAVRVLADLHAIENAEERFARLVPANPGDTALARRVGQARAWYEFIIPDCGRSLVLDRGFAWLDDHRPKDPGPTVLSWGDSRIGNVIWRDFEPAAVLDWEMATLGPRELDLGWLVYSHRIFQDIAEVFELPGLPDFLRPDDAAAEYERITGYAMRDLEFYLNFAAIQWGIVLLRVGTRQVHFGEIAAPDDVDDLLRNREGLEAMFAGTYWT